MNRRRVTYLLTCLSEECSELAKEASKALRFGPHDTYQGITPHARMETELADIRAVLVELDEAGLCIAASLVDIAAKRVKLAKAMAYSRKTGLIKP